MTTAERQIGREYVTILFFLLVYSIFILLFTTQDAHHLSLFNDKLN